MPRTAAKSVPTPVKKTAPRKTAAPATPAKRAVRVKKTIVEAAVNLNAYIPDPSISTRYIGRKVNGVWDITMLENAVTNKRNVLLMGDTGAGKTMLSEAYASKKQCLYYSLPCDVSIDPSALFGKMQPTDVPGKFEWQDGPVTQVVRQGGVLNISEVNFMPPKIAASLYPLLDGRRYVPLLGHKGEVVRAHDDLLIIADMNPQYRGTMDLNAAFKNRFAFKVQWGYSEEVEKRLVKFDSLRDMARKVREMVGVEIMTPVSTNMLMEFETFATDPMLGLEFAKQNFICAFDESEQAAIKNVFDLVMPVLQQEVAVALGSTDTDDDEDGNIVEFEFAEEGF
jgi:nitric oxide reductase NorQ protein